MQTPLAYLKLQLPWVRLPLRPCGGLADELELNSPPYPTILQLSWLLSWQTWVSLRGRLVELTALTVDQLREFLIKLPHAPKASLENPNWTCVFFFPRTAAWSPSSFFCHFCLFCLRKQPSFSLRGFWARNLATGHWGCCSLFFLLGASIIHSLVCKCCCGLPTHPHKQNEYLPGCTDHYRNLLLIFGLLEIAQLRPFLRCPLAETKCVRDAWRPKTCAQN